MTGQLDLRQQLFDFHFDEDGRRQSGAAALEELPRLIHSATRQGRCVTIEDVFSANCNDTPITSDIISEQLQVLRREKEIIICSEAGRVKPRSRDFDWGDQIRLPRQRAIFSRFSDPIIPSE